MSNDRTGGRRRARTIGIVMAVIAVAAILVHFGAEALHVPALREVALLVILAEILVFVALERYQVFEPMNETMEELRGEMKQLTELRRQLGEGGYTFTASDAPATWKGLGDLLQEALGRRPERPQVLRVTLLHGTLAELTMSHSESDQQWRDTIINPLRGFIDYAENRARTPWVTSWTLRYLFAAADEAAVDRLRDWATMALGRRPANVTIKLLPRHAPQAALSPVVVGDYGVGLGIEDNSYPYPHFGVMFRGPQYAALFARWFDELWEDAHAVAVYAHGRLDERAIELVRRKVGELGRAAGNGGAAV
jgi:hypothetical protein